MAESVQIKIVNNSPYVLNYAHFGDAGADLCANIESDYVLLPGTRTIVPTGIYMAVPLGYEAQVRSRSGLAYKHGIAVVNSPGTIDCGYRGEIMVALINHSGVPFTITPGMRIAQLIISPVAYASFIKVQDLDETIRGTGGFGSTGI